MPPLTKGELLEKLASKGIHVDPATKKDALVIRAAASAINPKGMSRAEIEKLTAATLSAILLNHGAPIKGLKRKSDFVNAVVGLNTEVAERERQSQAENKERLENVPTDALRLVMSKLSVPEQIRASMAFNNKDLLREARLKGADLPTKFQAGAPPGTHPRARQPPEFETLPREDLLDRLPNDLLQNNVEWTLKNDFVTLEHTIMANYGRGNYRFKLTILPVDRKVRAVVHYLHEDDVYSSVGDFFFHLNTMDKTEIKNGMSYIRVGLHWMHQYLGRPLVQRKVPGVVRLLSVPPVIADDQKTQMAYFNMIHRLLKKAAV